MREKDGIEAGVLVCFLDRYRPQFGAGVGMYQYVHEDDENTFQLVDSTRLPKPAFQKRTRFQQNVRPTDIDPSR